MKIKNSMVFKKSLKRQKKSACFVNDYKNKPMNFDNIVM